MNGDIPISGPGFEALMREIDGQLTGRNLSIPQRPINAIIAVGQKFRISIPLGPVLTGIPSMPAEVEKHAPLSDAIIAWYDRTYGDRVKMDFSPGSMVLLLGGDLWTLRFPRVMGTVMFVVGREFRSRGSNFSQRPMVWNVVQSIADMSEPKAATLTDAELSYVYESFLAGFHAISLLEGSNRLHQLVPIARGNLSAAVDHLTHQQPQFGESKWASLQMAEKLLKAAIELGGGAFTKTHKLADLFDQTTKVGISADWAPLLARIQCSPGIRYGEQPCDRAEALAAHHASLQLVSTLVDAGAKFKSSHTLNQ